MNRLGKTGLAVMLSFFVVVSSAQAAIYLGLDQVEQGAEYAKDPMFDSVLSLYSLDSNTNTWAGVTSFLLDPYWVGTVGHGVDGASEVRLFSGNSIFESYTSYDADAWYIHPEYTGIPGRGVDLALVHLAEPIYDITPTTLYSGEDSRGTLLSMAGYGSPGTASSGPGSYDGKKRAGNNIAMEFGEDYAMGLKIDPEYWVVDFNFDYDDALNLEWQSSSHDSGAPYLAPVVDGKVMTFEDLLGAGMSSDALVTETLLAELFPDSEVRFETVGVNTGIFGNYGYGVSTGIRTSLYNDWIYGTMDFHDSQSTAVPEPGSFILLLTGALGSIPVLRKRKRS